MNQKCKLPVIFCAFWLLLGSSLHAQSKTGYISISELIQLMPEFKKVDSSLSNYQNALAQNYQEMVGEFNEKDSLLSSKDTIRFTREQIEVRKKGLGELYTRVQGYQQQAAQLLQQKQTELMEPIRKKANEIVWQIAREHGYAYVYLKEALAVYPAGDDLMPFAKSKLGLK